MRTHNCKPVKSETSNSLPLKYNSIKKNLTDINGKVCKR